MPKIEIDSIGLGTASLLSATQDAANNAGIREDDLLTIVSLKEKNGKRFIMIPLLPENARILTKCDRGESNKSQNIKKALLPILGANKKRYSKKKIVVHRILLSVVNNKLQTEVAIKEYGCHEINKYRCALEQGLLVSLINRTRIMVDEELFKLWINFDQTTIEADQGTQKNDMNNDLRERLRNMKPEEFGNFKL